MWRPLIEQWLLAHGYKPSPENVIVIMEILLDEAKAGEVAGWNRPPDFVSPPTKFGVQYEKDE